MAKSTYLSMRIDPELKKRASVLYDSLGMNMTDAITLFINQSLLTGGLPFKVEHPDSKTGNIQQADRH